MCVCPQYEGQFTVFSNSFSGLTFSENTVFGFISQSFFEKDSQKSKLNSRSFYPIVNPLSATAVRIHCTLAKFFIVNSRTTFLTVNRVGKFSPDTIKMHDSLLKFGYHNGNERYAS